jgi:uncharacterized protein
LLGREEYGPALVFAVTSVAQAYAQEFGVTLTGVPEAPAQPATRPQGGIPIGIIVAILLILLLSRGRGLLLPFILGGMGGGRRGGWSGGGWGAGGGGGFGGFGGGGGFSGGGAGGRF